MPAAAGVARTGALLLLLAWMAVRGGAEAALAPPPVLRVRATSRRNCCRWGCCVKGMDGIGVSRRGGENEEGGGRHHVVLTPGWVTHRRHVG